MHGCRRNKPRVYVTLTAENVRLAYSIYGPRSISPLLDRLLTQHLATLESPLPVEQKKE